MPSFLRPNVSVVMNLGVYPKRVH